MPVVALKNRYGSKEKKKLSNERMERGEMQGSTEPTIIPIIVRDILCLAQLVPMYDLIPRRHLMGTNLNGNSMAHCLFES